jgi:hypothetical protein
VHPPPSPARTNFTLITECKPDSSGCNSVGESACWQDQGVCETVVDPEEGMSPLSPSRPRMGEREGRQYAPPQQALSPLLILMSGEGRGGRERVVLKAGKPEAIEKHFLPLARKPADEAKNTASVVDP